MRATAPCPVCGVTRGPCFRRDGITPRGVRHAGRDEPERADGPIPVEIGPLGAPRPR